MRRSECAFPTKEKKELRAKPTNAYSRAGKMLHMLLFTAQKPNMIKFVRNSFLQSPFWRKRRKKCWEMCCFFRGMLRWTRYVQKNNIQRFTCLVPGIRWMNLFEILFECVCGKCLIWNCDLFGRRQLCVRIIVLSERDGFLHGFFCRFRKIDFAFSKKRESKSLSRSNWFESLTLHMSYFVWIALQVKFCFRDNRKFVENLLPTEKCQNFEM